MEANHKEFWEQGHSLLLLRVAPACRTHRYTSACWDWPVPERERERETRRERDLKQLNELHSNIYVCVCVGVCVCVCVCVCVSEKERDSVYENGNNQTNTLRHTHTHAHTHTGSLSNLLKLGHLTTKKTTEGVCRCVWCVCVCVCVCGWVGGWLDWLCDACNNKCKIFSQWVKKCWNKSSKDEKKERHFIEMKKISRTDRGREGERERERDRERGNFVRLLFKCAGCGGECGPFGNNWLVIRRGSTGQFGNKWLSLAQVALHMR